MVTVSYAPTWTTMIGELIGMVQAADSATTPGAYDWAIEQLDKIGEHLDQLPAEHALPMVNAKEFFNAKREVLAS